MSNQQRQVALKTEALGAVSVFINTELICLRQPNKKLTNGGVKYHPLLGYTNPS
jgi:hypothetical protein